MNCNYILSTSYDMYFKSIGFVDVCVNRTGTTTRYYFNDIKGDTKELLVNSSVYSIVDVNNVQFNGLVYKYRDYNTVFLLGILVVIFILFLEKIMNWVFGIGRSNKNGN